VGEQLVLVEGVVGRADDGDAVRAGLRGVRGERNRLGSRLRPAVDDDGEPPRARREEELRGALPLRGGEQDSLPGRPEREDTVEPAGGKNSTSGANASSSRAMPPPRSGVTAAASAPRITTEI
jgi:hypothetical protein